MALNHQDKVQILVSGLMRKRTSKIWLLPEDAFRSLIAHSKTYTEVLEFFGLKNRGNNIVTLKQRLSYLTIDCTHFDQKINQRSVWNKTKSLDTLLVEKSVGTRKSIKKKLIDSGLLNNACYVCGQLPTWRGVKLILVLDHINGISDDYRLENLRLLCPNCNSQTNTFAGRNTKRKSEQKVCSVCGQTINRRSTLCKSCSHRAPRISRRKVERPHRDILNRQIEELGYCGAGRLYGVSDNAIRKWIKT